MLNAFSRTELLLGKESMERLSKARVAVFGLGGVGGYALEVLARSGVGAMDLIDNDTISLTNLNRQILATHNTVGRLKTEVAAERVRSINPDAKIRVWPLFYTPETENQFDFTEYDYIIDAIDTVTGKLALAVNAKAAGTPLISSMGTGNKLDPTGFAVMDISETTFCPLARVMRKELKKRGIYHLKVVASREPPLTPNENMPEETPGRRQLTGSVAFVPSVAGMILGGQVVLDLCGDEIKDLMKHPGR